MTEVCVEGIIERESVAKQKARRQNAIRSELLLRRLQQHHDYRMFRSDVENTADPIVLPRDHSAEFKELWFGAPEEVIAPVPMIDDVKRAVCRFYSLTNVEIISSRRTRETTRPRQIAMYLAKHLTGKSYPEIARRFGRRDHTTAISSVKRVEQLCLSDWEVAHDVAHLEGCFQ